MRQIGYGARNPARRVGEEADELRIWRGYLCAAIERAHHHDAQVAYEAEVKAQELAREMVRLVRRRGLYTECVPLLTCWECLHTWEAHHRSQPDHFVGLDVEVPGPCRAGACPCVEYVDPLSCATCGCPEHAHDCGPGRGECLECSRCESYTRRGR